MDLVGFIIWLVIGGIVGWIASKIMNTDAQQGLLLNIVVGIVGAFLAGLLFSSFFGGSTINENPLNLGSILVSLLGAIVLLGIVNLFRRGTAR